MKKILCIALVSSSIAAFSQTVIRVNNNFGVTGTNVYASIQEAHDAANPNDILLVEPSSTNYGTLTLTKPLKIYGNGYFLDVNKELRADPRTSQFDYMYFDTGSDGTEVYGMTGNYFYIHGASNIKIARNKATYVYIYTRNKANTVNTNVTNVIVQNNYLTGVFGSPTTSYTVANVSVNNNIMDYMTANNTPEIQNWIVSNNTFTWSNGIQLVNSVFENNLLMYHKTLTFTNTTASYNVSAGASFNGGVGNVDNFDVLAELVGTGTGISDDEKVRVKEGSALKTMGNGSTEVGAFGGTFPYVISGIPAIPAVLHMVNSGTGDGSNPLNVTISVKSNN